ncbi:winged helix-turn-helix transcriptional regulator [Paraburkholderia sp. SIMBA_054]|uniref:winged helix-turn-helix transcriptional regulator n=1 Tax=Paraburkholderia sp. SIMBA_054 TaxID=3085795 RepID=UPI00397CB3AB
METVGLVNRVDYKEIPPRVGYTLTAFGLAPVSYQTDQRPLRESQLHSMVRKKAREPAQR